MDDMLQPKSEVNKELLNADYGNNKRHMENVQLKVEIDQSSCMCDVEIAKRFRKERRDACKYCSKTECLVDMEEEVLSGSDLELIRLLIGYLKLYNMFNPEDFLLPNPENIPSCQLAEEKIILLENEVRKKFDVPFFLYRDLFSYPVNKAGKLTKSPYEARLFLFVKLLHNLPKYYEHLQDRIEKFDRIFTATVFASQEIPNFYKVIFGAVEERNWNIYFEGLHPRMISRLLNRFNESEKNSLEFFFTSMGLTTDDIFERMDMYEVKNMEYFKKNPVSNSVLQKYSGYRIKKRFPVVHKYVTSII